MGCENSKPIQHDGPERSKRASMYHSILLRQKDREIDREQQLSAEREDEKVKLLLLGAGESGKSTVFKQMRIIYGSPKTDEELRMYGVFIRSNIVTAIRKLCELTRQLDLVASLDEESVEATSTDDGMTPRQAYDQIVSHLVDFTASNHFPDILDEEAEQDWVGESNRAGRHANKEAKCFLQHAEAIRVLWQSSTIQDVWYKRALANINDSHNQYLSDVTRIASPKYIPTDQDVIISRVRTTQVSVETYIVNELELEVYDVGGQRPNRGKWLSYFDNVDAVIFVAALSEYDQVLTEAKQQNRMIEALNLFDSVVKNKYFVNKPVMLFLNKRDVFAEKIMYSNIVDSPFFSDFAGPARDYDHGVLYFIHKFEEHIEEEEFDAAFIHVTCATDTENMNFVLDSVGAMLMKLALEDVGITE